MGEKTGRSEIDNAFREESDLLLRWLISRLGNRHDAEDVMQNCYLRILAFSEENHIDNARALIFRTASNLAIDEIRRRKRARTSTMSPEADEERELIANIDSGAPDCEKMLMTREDITEAIEALDAHPPNVKRSFILSRVDGKTYAEIADALGVSISAVEKYMIKAVKTLRGLKVEQNRQEGVPPSLPEPSRNQLRRIAKYRALLAQAGQK
ncbi:MAG: sigma-70 family RNA polymerase sigma factor [Parvularculaceae bacterium]